MNAKKAKTIRRVIKRIGVDFRETKYIDSEHPREKPHKKEYPLNMVKWTISGAKNMTKYVPFKVGTHYLSGCGKKVYRHYKSKKGFV